MTFAKWFISLIIICGVIFSQVNLMCTLAITIVNITGKFDQFIVEIPISIYLRIE